LFPPNAQENYRDDHPTRLYRLVADESVVRLTSFGGTKAGAVFNILRKYIDDFYRIRREHNESMAYRPLDESDPNSASTGRP
jgi:hypothetical protein